MVKTNGKHSGKIFYCRAWVNENSAEAASAPAGEKGFKGIVAGGITGCLDVLITYPIEFVKTQLQLDEKGDRKQYSGMFDCVKKTVQKRGFFGLYRGLSVLLYGSFPKSAVRFGSYESLKGLLIDDSGQLSAGRKVLAGLGAGVCEAIVVGTPIETLKVKFVHDQRSDQPKFKSFSHGVHTIVQSEGIGGVYRGLTATILKQGSSQALRFFIIETLKDLYTGRNPEKNIPKLLVGLFGAIAGAASVFANNPFDVIKTRMQGLDALKYRNTIDCAIQIFRNEGVFAFYKGTLPRLSRASLNVGATFMIYDSFMDILKSV